MLKRKNIIFSTSIMSIVGLMLVVGSTIITGKRENVVVAIQNEVLVQESIGIYEAEDGIFYGNVKSDTSMGGYQGGGYVTGFQEDGDGVEILVQVKESGHYDLNFVSASSDGFKANDVHVNGEKVGTVSVDKKEFDSSFLKRIYLEEGTQTIRLEKSWGWIALDYVEVVKSIPVDEAIFQVEKTLINEDASEEARRLYSFLVDNYGKNIITGQYAENGRYSKELFALSNITNGEYPAMIGLDLIEYSPSRVENGSTSKAVEMAIEYDSLGGIVTLCWHWNPPTKYLTTNEPWWRGFYTEASSIDIEKIMNGEDKEGLALLEQDIELIAKELKRLEDAKVPVLFRPLHEASGGWFWWGSKGHEPYIELWKLLYDRITNVHNINNLIWVWNGQGKEWYPGDEYVDIIGEDIYPGKRVYTSQSSKFDEAVEYTSTSKIIAMTENGCFFDPDLALRDRTPWSYFGTWSGEFLLNSFGGFSDKYNEEAIIKKVYQHERVITLKKLPNLKTYPMN